MNDKSRAKAPDNRMMIDKQGVIVSRIIFPGTGVAVDCPGCIAGQQERVIKAGKKC